MAEVAVAPRRAAFGKLAQWGGIALLAASLVFIGVRLFHLDWSSLRPHFSWELASALAGACGLFAVADYALAKAWAALADPEHKLTAREAGRIYGRGVLMKYLPGSVFQYVSRQIGGAEAGLAHKQLVRSSAAEIGLHLVASVGIAVVCLLFEIAPAIAAMGAAVPICLGLMLRRPVLISLALQLTAFAGFALAAALAGAVILPPGSSLAHFAALFMLAWLAGFVVPVAPGGLGVREAALLALAGGAFPATDLLAATLALRAASIGGDLAYCLVALARGRIRNP